MKETLAGWENGQRCSCFRGKRKMVVSKIHILYNSTKFKATFFTNKKTTTRLAVPDRSMTKTVNLINYCKQIKVSNNIKNENIGNMDETTIWAIMP
ncbi:hypothetical protein HZS_1159 [Henneguya salminicola]|nr:hypothetical protein HZS_1159 [Henneguya salminicola]